MVKSVTNLHLSNRLLDLGCLPGEIIYVARTAPLGCPLAITVSGAEFSLRKEEAASVLIELVA